MTRKEARHAENLLFKAGWFTFTISWLLMLATFIVGALLTDYPFSAGYPPIWMMVPPFVGLVLIFASIIVGELGGAWKLD